MCCIIIDIVFQQKVGVRYGNSPCFFEVKKAAPIGWKMRAEGFKLSRIN